MIKDNIRKFEKQSGIDVYSLGLDRNKWDDKLEKFTELIVKECIRLCDQVDLAGADDCIDKIKDHFGVEE